ncbi:sensor histidine kinase [Streptomyces coffeae]|uniref:sensor histidine kinase n=1 Tax=Streptomyces coffeae TaxID=621382 RepID=UPI001F362D65|nr:histidine kinase [Streptomyces coffeae]
MGSSSTTRPPRRTVRDWFVDPSIITLAAFFSLFASASVAEDPSMSDNVLFADVMAGALACLALWQRRRWPVGLALTLLAVGAVSFYVSGPLLVALFTVAVHRPLRTVALVGVAAVAQLLITPALRPDPDLAYLESVLLGAVLIGGVIGWGMFVRSRRQLLESLRERALRAESEAALRAERIQRLTRERIAREMHDVLAHRLSLLSVHAGALEYRSDASPDEVARAAGVIRSSAHQALQDLREVIGVLRSPDSDPADPAPPDRPQPALTDLPRLVEESRQAGMRVILRDGIGGTAAAEAVPGATGRTAYRIVQEGLTNARKHAPYAEVTVVTAGSRGEGLTVEIRNSLHRTVPQQVQRSRAVREPVPAGEQPVPAGEQPVLAGERGSDAPTAIPSPVATPAADASGSVSALPAIPGAGQGLIGLAERAELTGGRLESGPSDSGDFRLYAWLPWPA